MLTQKTMLNLLLGAILASMAVVACSNEHTQPQRSGPVALEDLQDAYAKVICGLSRDCHTRLSLLKPMVLAAAAAGSCEENIAEVLVFENIVQGVLEGRYIYDGESARECLNALLLLQRRLPQRPVRRFQRDLHLS